MPKTAAITPILPLEELIHSVRGCRVMLDADLAQIYGVPLKRLNEQVKRNQQRFPAHFAFRLADEEWETMRSQIATASKRNLRFPPWAFTERGALMLAAVLNSAVAIEASIRVIHAFVFLREQLAANRELARKLAELESRVTSHDAAIEQLFEAIRQLIEPPLPENRREIGFHIRETAPPYRVRTRARCRT
jgi:hypothetical protein